MNWFRRWFRSSDHDADLREEMEHHLSARAELNRQSGIEAPDSAAHKRFGSQLAAQETTRAVWRWAWFDDLTRDAAYALRGFRRSPAFFATAALTLALGIAAATAVFSVVDPLLFRGLPYPNSHELVSVGYFGPVDTNEFTVISSYLDWRKQAAPFLTLTSMRPNVPCDLATGAKQLTCAAVESNFLSTFGLHVQAGRDFTPDDDRVGAPPTALLTHTVWQQQFGGDPALINRTVLIDELPTRVIGILPKEFEMPQLGDAGILLTERLRTNVPRAENSSGPLRAFGRIRKGLSIHDVLARMEPMMLASANLDAPYELRKELRVVVRSLRDRQIHEVKLASWMLLGIVGALLALACANVANLLLARSASRDRELALRSAIGAGHGRLIRQTLTESLMLALIGGAAGATLGWLLLQAFLRLAPTNIPRIAEASLNSRALAFALAISALSSLLFGVWPALHRPRFNSMAIRTATSAKGSLFRRSLVSFQIAISLVLLSGASLLLHSFSRLQTQSLGFEPQRLVTASFTLRAQRYRPPGAEAAFYTDLEQRLARLGGTSFALTDSIPPQGGAVGRPYSNIRIAGGPPVKPNGGMVLFRRVTPAYFRVMQIPIIAGRGFLEAERTAGQTPIILSATLARRMFGDENAVGHSLELSGDGVLSPIVGVAADVKNSGLDVQAAPEYYRLRMISPNPAQGNGRGAVALLRSSLPASTINAFLKREFAAVDPTLPVDLNTMDQKVQTLQARPRFIASLVTLFASIGLLLASVGLYGVLSFLVAQRTREIGVRMALGAQRSDVRRHIQRQAANWTALGIVAGLAGSIALARFIQGLLFEVSPRDPLSIVAAIAVLVIVAAIASWLPSHRASRVAPAIALRAD